MIDNYVILQDESKVGGVIVDDDPETGSITFVDIKDPKLIEVVQYLETMGLPQQGFFEEKGKTVETLTPKKPDPANFGNVAMFLSEYGFDVIPA